MIKINGYIKVKCIQHIRTDLSVADREVEATRNQHELRVKLAIYNGQIHQILLHTK